jgi:hypothetical protein
MMNVTLLYPYTTSTTFRCLTAFGGNEVKLEVEFVFFFLFFLLSCDLVLIAG